jgi:predicted small integral membrane protein
MDTTFPEKALLYRHITSPALWQVGYALIIVGRGRGAVRHCPGGRNYLSCLASAL